MSQRYPVICDSCRLIVECYANEFCLPNEFAFCFKCDWDRILSFHLLGPRLLFTGGLLTSPAKMTVPAELPFSYSFRSGPLLDFSSFQDLLDADLKNSRRPHAPKVPPDKTFCGTRIICFGFSYFVKQTTVT